MQLSSFVIVDKTAEAPQTVLPQKRSQRILQNILVRAVDLQSVKRGKRYQHVPIANALSRIVPSGQIV